MGSPMIENSDRGITLNKQLAWTIGTAIVVGGFWIGSTVTGLQTTTSRFSADLIESRTAITADIAAEKQASMVLETRVRSLEVSTTRQDARFDALSRSLDELKSQQRETNDLLRQIMTKGVK